MMRLLREIPCRLLARTAVQPRVLAALIQCATIGQLHDDVILLQLPESLSLLFSCAN